MKEANKGAWGLILVLTLVGGFACDGGDFSFPAFSSVDGSGNIVQETRSVTGATGVDLRIGANLTIEQGAPEELTLETDDNLMARILTDVQGGILVIRPEPSVSLRPSQRQGPGIEAHLTLSRIDSITLWGPGLFSIPLSGAGSITVPDLRTPQLEVILPGLGDISIAAGQVDDQIITLSSAGNYDAANLRSATADVEITGGGSATVRVSTTLNANITGSGSVFYHGSPVVTRTGAGTGRVVQRSP